MLLEAIEDWSVDVAHSILIGDKVSDIQAAEAAGIRGVRYSSGSVLELVRETVRR